jgi:hypothetical protein
LVFFIFGIAGKASPKTDIFYPKPTIRKKQETETVELLKNI